MGDGKGSLLTGDYRHWGPWVGDCYRDGAAAYGERWESVDGAYWGGYGVGFDCGGMQGGSFWAVPILVKMLVKGFVGCGI